MDHAAALGLVYEAIDLANELRRPEDHIPKESHVKLIGEEGRLDSLALATLLLAVERRAEQVTGRSILLLDDGDHDVELQLGRLETPSSLAALVVEKLDG